jgi:hypothetical protein
MSNSGTGTQASEQTPLLPPRSPRSVNTEISSPESKKSSSLLIITLVLLFVLSLEAGDQMIGPAQTRVFESIYCRQYYEKHDPSAIHGPGRNGVDEELCKISVIQGQVAMLKGWQLTFDGLGSKFALSLPFEGYAV